MNMLVSLKKVQSAELVQRSMKLKYCRNVFSSQQSLDIMHLNYGICALNALNKLYTMYTMHVYVQENYSIADLWYNAGST